ncbi:mCG128631, isoform CRA_b, partial [Mus musculus]
TRRRRRLRWGAVGREAADQSGEEFARGGAWEDSPSSVKSWAQRALCTPAAGARRSRARCTWAWGLRYNTNPQDLGRPAQPQTQGISALSSRRRSGCCLHILGESLLWHNSPARCWNSVCSHHTDMADLSQWWKSGEIWERSRLACKAALQISIISPACLLSAGACEKGSALESPTGGRMAVL